MKKLFSFLLALCMTISLAACGQQVGSGGTSSTAGSGASGSTQGGSDWPTQMCIRDRVSGMSRSFTARSRTAWSIRWTLWTVVVLSPLPCFFPTCILPLSNNSL